jgi:hypothetical protein
MWRRIIWQQCTDWILLAPSAWFCATSVQFYHSTRRHVPQDYSVVIKLSRFPAASFRCRNLNFQLPYLFPSSGSNIFLGGSGSNLTLLGSGNITCMKRTKRPVYSDNSWWWAQKMPKTCRVSWQNKFWIFDASSWLFYTKFITMHGHLNIKYI